MKWRWWLGAIASSCAPHSRRRCVVACVLLAACTDSTAVGPTPEVLSKKMLQGLVVSGPLSSRSGVTAAGASVDVALAYVAMYPGALQEGDSVHVSVATGAGAFASGPMLDGGFDPIGVLAGSSDSLDVEALTANGTVIARVRVPAARAPSVIRSVPARGRTDVPLSQIITIVFSQPLDATTVDGTSIRLVSNGTVVPCAVSVNLSKHWEVDLQPSSLLSSNSTYTVIVGDAIRDVDGNPLATGVRIDFTTGSELPPPASIAVRSYAGYNQVESDVAIASPGEAVPFAIADVLATGDTIIATSSSTAASSATWTSSDPNVATVSSFGVANAVAPGRAEIEACLSDVCAHATLFVLDTRAGASPTAIGDLGGDWSSASDMSGDQVTGQSRRSDGALETFLWSKQRGTEDLGISHRDIAQGQLVNQDGTVIGSDTPGSSWIWTRANGMRPLTLPDSQHQWLVGGINSQGTVVFSAIDGTLIGLWNAATGGRVAPAPAKSVFAHRMNDAGQIAFSGSDAQYYYFQDTVAYVWDSNSGRVASTLLPRNSVTRQALYIWPATINSHGDVAGYVSIDGTEATAFTWSSSTGFRYLKLGDQTVSSAVVALNDFGDAAVTLFTYTRGATTDLKTARGAVWTAAGDLIMLASTDPVVSPVGINNSGIVSGTTSTDLTFSQNHAQVWDITPLTASRSKGTATASAHLSPSTSATAMSKSSTP